MEQGKQTTDYDKVRHCKHTTAEPLGSNTGMIFFRCLACHAVIVTHGDLRFAVPAVETAQ